jgi:hypothetical protein
MALSIKRLQLQLFNRTHVLVPRYFIRQRLPDLHATYDRGNKKQRWGIPEKEAENLIRRYLEQERACALNPRRESQEIIHQLDKIRPSSPPSRSSPT